jgi:hypothetical protein
MRRIQRYHTLSTLGDLKPHPYVQVISVGTLHISNPVNRTEIWGSERIPRNKYSNTVFELWIKKCIGDDLIKRVENDTIKKIRLQPEYQIAPEDYDLQLTQKGRDCLAMEQIQRSGDYRFYKNFDGTVDSAKKINPGLF